MLWGILKSTKFQVDISVSHKKIIEMFLDITLPEICETFFPKNYFKFALEFPAEFSSNFPVKQQNGINSGTTQQI